MAGKDYTVNLDVKVGDGVSNISELLEKLIALRSEANNLSSSEIALNVVVRNQGFDAAMAQISQKLENTNKKAKNAGKSFASGFEDASKELDETAQKTVKIYDQIGKSIKKTFDGLGKNLEKTIISGIRTGVQEGMKGLRSDVGTKLTSIKSDIAEAGRGFGDIVDKADRVYDSFDKAAIRLKSASQEWVAAYTRGELEMGKAGAHDIWSETHISRRDQGYLDAENRRIERQEDRADRAQAKSDAREMKRLNAEIAKSERQEKAETKRIVAETNKLQKEALRNVAQTSNLEADTNVKRQRYAEMLAKAEKEQIQKRQQLKAIDDAHNEANRTALREQTELEKQLVRYANSVKRVEDQILATQLGKRVSLQAINKAAQARRQEEYKTYQLITKQILGYDRIKSSTERLTKTFNTWGVALQRMSSLTSSITSMFSSVRSWATATGNMLVRIGQYGLRYATRAASTIVSTASEQYNKLEIARIGFENFYGKATTDTLIPRIQQEAINAPGLNSGDLADYVRQLAPVSQGNADIALNAALGMLKTIQYGGAEGSEEMEYVIKNIRDVISKGKATAIDLRQFNRAMPIFEDVLGKIGRSDFLKDGKLNITKENASEILKAFADINTNPNSPVSDIYNKIGNTIEGLKEAIKEQFTTGLNNTLVDLGFYEKVRNLLKQVRDDGIVDSFFKWIGNTANSILDFVRTLDWAKIKSGFTSGGSKVWESMKKGAQSIMNALGTTDLGSVIDKVLGFLASFIEGAGEGIAKIIDIIDYAEKNIDPEIVNKIGKLFGTLATPFGRLIEFLGRSMADIFSLLSRLSYLGGLATTKYGQMRLGGIMNKTAGLVADVKNQGFYNSTIQNPFITSLIGAAGTRAYGGIGNTVLYNKAQDIISSYNAETMSWTTNGGVSNMKWLDRQKLLGGGSAVKGIARQFTEVAGKAVKSMAFYSVGSAVSEIAGQIAKSATGNSDVGTVTTALGKSLSAGIAVGSQFGLVAGASASLVSAIGSVIKAQIELEESTKKLYQSQVEASYSDMTNNVWESLYNDLTRNGKFEAYNKNDLSAKDKTYEVIDQMLREGGHSMTEIMEEARNIYLQTRAAYMTAGQFNEWGKTFETSGATALDKEGMAGTLKQIYEKGVAMGWFEKATADLTTGGEYANYLNNVIGLGIDTNEEASAVLDKMLELKNSYDNEASINVPVKFYYGWGGESREISSEEEWKDLMGILSVGNDGYVKKTYIEAYVNVNGKDKELLEKLYGLGDSDTKSAIDKLTTPTSISTVTDAFGNIKQGRTSRGRRLYYYGGYVQPIYRAGGGDARGVDTVPVMAQPGEFVLRQSSASRLGGSVLAALNSGDFSHAARLLSGKVFNSWNNSRSYDRSVRNTTKTVNNNISIFNRTRGGTLGSYLGLANRIAAGI